LQVGGYISLAQTTHKHNTFYATCELLLRQSVFTVLLLNPCCDVNCCNDSQGPLGYHYSSSQSWVVLSYSLAGICPLSEKDFDCLPSPLYLSR
jgi:hypothetical protein